jgi:hypothetical protein
MSAARDELRRLVEDLPEDEVPAVLAEARRHLVSVTSEGWPPPWFGIAEGDRDDLGRNHEDVLAEGFGRS